MNDDTAEFSISWQGTVTGPYSIKEIRYMLKSSKINSLYRIKVEGDWVMIRDYLAQIDLGHRDKLSRHSKYVESHSVHSDNIQINRPVSRVVSVQQDSIRSDKTNSEIACYHINRGGQRLGPFSGEQIQDMINSSMLSQDDLFWREGNQEWITIRNEFQRTNPPMIPAQPERVKVVPRISSVHPGFWIRMGAYLIDFVLSSIVNIVAAFLLGFIVGASGINDRDLLNFLVSILGIIGNWLYYALFESSTKQATPGKLAFDFVVTDMNGERISFGIATGRYFGMILSWLILGFGFIICAFNEKKQCLHDILSGCLMYKKNE